MDWIRTDCYSPSSSSGDSAGADDTHAPRKRCPLHKKIRNHSWSYVLNMIRQDPSQICQMNGHGWSSLTLAVYHTAPVDVIAEMLALLSQNDQVQLLSTPVPNGSRLCLHFAARYAENPEVIKILTESYPYALLVSSNDGVIPLDRATYYRKDGHILEYLKQATKRQRNLEKLRKHNAQLRRTVLKSCERNLHTMCFRKTRIDQPVAFVVDLYGYSKEREMIGLFWNVLSYVGVTSIAD